MVKREAGATQSSTGKSNEIFCRKQNRFTFNIFGRIIHELLSFN